MKYTPKNYEEDLKISNWVFNRYFKHYKAFKDDMIQTAIIKLWQTRPQFNEQKSKYSTYACLIAYREMLILLRKEKKYLRDISLYEETDDGLLLIDTIPANDTSDTKNLLLKIKAILAGFDNKDRKFIILYLRNTTQAEIAKQSNISTGYISKQIKYFKELLKKRLNIKG